MNKIPEGTQYIESGCGEKGFRKYEKGCWWFFEGHWRHVDWQMGDLIPVSEHPFCVTQPSAWNGEDLPPVGTVCEFAGFNPEETTFDDPVVGDKITVIAHYLSGCVQVAAFTYNCATNFGSLNVAQGAHGCFRPFRTSEQIEADQKKQEVQELMIILGSVESAAYKDIAIAIQQANFRKQVSQ